MGQVGGNGSVVWQNQHQPKQGKFTCKDQDHKKLDRYHLAVGNKLEVWGRDEVAIEAIGLNRAPGLEAGLENFQNPGYFLVRLRFDGAEAEAVRKWFNASRQAAPQGLITLVDVGKTGDTVILAINVKALSRNWSEDDNAWEEMPWEIRYDW